MACLKAKAMVKRMGNFGHCPKRGGGLAVSKDFRKIKMTNKYTI